MRIIEIYSSIQGETTWAGYPCTFVRLSGCNLHCRYCDTGYARDEPGRDMSIPEIVREVDRLGLALVVVTGGEPLCQEDTPLLLDRLDDLGVRVLLETNGTLPLPVDIDKYHVIMDVKCPGSEAGIDTEWGNIERLRGCDEVKFVITGRQDFEWASRCVRFYRFGGGGPVVLFSPATPAMSAQKLAEWILHELPAVRLQLQLHTILWPEQSRGT